MATLENCEILVQKSKLFTKTTNYIDGFEIISFNYQDGTHYADFLEHDGFHMRGLTFVNGVRFPMLDKFFNLGEKHTNEIEEAKIKKIKSIQKKDDGSLIGFIVLPNGRVIAKTKVGLSNEFTEIANNWLLENSNENKIKTLFEKGIFPLFECVSNRYPVVLKYDWEGLVLIQARREDLSFLDTEELENLAYENKWHFEKPLKHTLEELLEIKDNIEGVEGFIVRFEDDTFTKVKTSWYFEKHASDEGLMRMNTIIGNHFEGIKEELEEFEKNFLEKLINDFLTPNSINSINELKAWIFRDGDTKDINKYKQLYKGFLTEYTLLNNYDNENTLIKLFIENKTDDILPELDETQREKLLKIERIVGEHVEIELDHICNILESTLEAKQIKEGFKGFEYIGIIFQFLKTDWTREEVKSAILKHIAKRTKKKKEATAWLEEKIKRRQDALDFLERRRKELE